MSFTPLICCLSGFNCLLLIQVPNHSPFFLWFGNARASLSETEVVSPGRWLQAAKSVRKDSGPPSRNSIGPAPPRKVTLLMCSVTNVLLPPHPPPPPQNPNGTLQPPFYRLQAKQTTTARIKCAAFTKSLSQVVWKKNSVFCRPAAQTECVKEVWDVARNAGWNLTKRNWYSEGNNRPFSGIIKRLCFKFSAFFFCSHTNQWGVCGHILQWRAPHPSKNFLADTVLCK